MIYFLIIIAIIFIIIFFISIFGPIKQRNSFEHLLKEFLEKEYGNFHFEKSSSSIYDYDLIINNHKYIIKTISIPSYALVQINSKTTWEVKYGAGPTPGKAQPHQKYLSSISSFMKYDEKESTKVIVFVPETKETVMYINECEIISVDYKTNVYGIRVINCNDFTLFKKENNN